MTAASPVELSVIVVSYNTRELLARCLRSLAPASPQTAHEIIVVDNASRDGSVEMLGRQFPWVTSIANTTNLGFARACNQGVRESRGRNLLFLNADTEPQPGSVSGLVGYLGDHPRVGAVGPRLRHPDGGWPRSCFRFPTLMRPLLNFRLVRRVAGDRFGLPYPSDDPRVREGGPVDWLSGACLLIRQEALEAAGLFDERYFMYLEDTDLCRRLWGAGWEVVFWPRAEVLHVGGASSRGHAVRLGIEHQRSRLIYFSTHHPGVVYLSVRCLAGLAALGRGLCSLARLRHEELRAEASILRLALWGVHR